MEIGPKKHDTGAVWATWFMKVWLRVLIKGQDFEAVKRKKKIDGWILITWL